MVWYHVKPCYRVYGRHRFYTEFEALVKFKIGRLVIIFVWFIVELGYKFAEVENSARLYYCHLVRNALPTHCEQ